MASAPGNSATKFPRRTSVTPAATQFSRSTTDYGSARCMSVNRGSISQGSESTGFSPGEKLRRMSMLFSIDKARTRDAILAALEDPARTEFRRLKHQNEHLTTEWKQLKKFIEQLHVDYESSRQLDPIRRFRQLQAMTKRTVMHLRLTEVGSASADATMNADVTLQGSVVQSEAKEREIEKRITQLCDKYTVEELQVENRRLRDSNDRLETRIQLIVQTINELDIVYRSTKSESVLKRYTTLRDAVKEVITNPDLTDTP